MPSTVRLHRVLATKPEKVFRAFVEPDAMASWLPPNGFLCTVHELEAKVGGRHRMSFRNLTTGGGHSFGGTYKELGPGECQESLPSSKKLFVQAFSVKYHNALNQGIHTVQANLVSIHRPLAKDSRHA